MIGFPNGYIQDNVDNIELKQLIIYCWHSYEKSVGGRHMKPEANLKAG